jgi:hypothetical protein
MSKLADKIRARSNDAPLQTEYMLDEAAAALDVAYNALRDVRNDIDGPAESIRTIDAALAKLEAAR